MTTTITTGSVPRLIQDGVNKVFGDGLKMHEKKYDKMYMMDNSRKNFEVDVQLEGFSRASQKSEGDDMSFDTRRQGFTPKYKHDTYAKGFIITREAMEDELYGQFNTGAQALAKCMMVTRELEAAAVYNNGFDTNSTMIDGDGKPLFALDHPLGPSAAGETFQNRLTVDADLSEAALEDLLSLIQNNKDARGLPMALNAMRLIVAAGNSTFTAQRILNSVLQSGTANNDTNAVRDMNSVRDGWMGSPYLTDPDAWFLTTDAPCGMRGFIRREIDFGQDNAFSSENARYKSSQRISFGWTDPRGAFGSQGA